MSNLLSQASLVMIPSGYKEDVVYSQIPTSGAGDLSFTRASNGTRINSAGLVEVCPWNLISYSEQFDSPFWNKGTSGSATFVVTANATTAPNGTNTADLISITRSATSELAATYTFVGQGIGTFKNTIWLKAKDSSNVGKTIDLWSWEGDTRGYTKVTLTADWVRYEQNTTVFTGTASELMDFGLLPISYSTSTTLAVEFYAWGAQSNIGSTAKPYFPTTDRLNVPRLTYQNGGGGCPSLLLEKQSTNTILYSEQFDNAGWSRDEVTNGANVTTSPDGTQNADTIVDNSTNGRHINYQSFSGDLSISRTLSVYAKQNSLRYLFLSVTNQSDIHCYSAIFDLQSGTVSATKTNGDATLSASIQSVGNGWYRCIISGTMTTGTANYFPLIGTSDRAGFTGSLVNNNAPIYTGSGQSLYLWGAQLEASSYPTSYIPTTSASATRVADACYKTGISSLIGQSQGTMFVDVDLTHPNASGTNEYLMQLYQAAGERIILYRDNSNGLSYYYLKGTTIFFYNSSVTTNGRHKLAFAYKSGDSAFYIDGVQIDTDTSTFSAFSSLSELHLGANYNPTQAEIGDYEYNEAIVFPTRLSNAELASLTTI